MRTEEVLPQVDAGRLLAHVQALAALHTRHVNSTGSGAAAAYIQRQFEAIDGLEVTLDTFPLAYNGIPTTQANVIATLPGRDPSAGSVLAGAHYDSRSAEIADAVDRAPGADDNATGVAALIEMARVLAALPQRPAATVIFVAFAAEEVGSSGSAHYMASYPTGDLRAVFVLDIVGNAAGQLGEGAIRLFASPADAGSQQLMRFVDVTANRALSGFDALPQPTADRPGRYSDHLSFSGEGVAAVRLIELVEDPDRQHSPADLPEAISPGYLRQSTQLALAGLLGAAALPPPDLTLIAGDATPDPSSYQLTWEPVAGAAGYVVGFRRSGALGFGAVVETDTTGYAGPELAGYDLVSVAAVDAAGRMGLFGAEGSLPGD
jgi:hypothetical protein